jgi:alpha-amylase
MPTPIYLSLVFHNHQPVGQFDYINEHVAHVSYLPLIELLEQHPLIHVGMHFSGHLLAWLQHKTPTLISRLRVLVERGQVELIGGGYYEPILTAIPDEDQAGQTEKLAQTLKSLFNTEPTGYWLAKRIWEANLPRILGRMGSKYAILKDHLFKNGGVEDQALFGYYVTSDGGHSLAIYPSLNALETLIPWRPVDELLHFLRTESDKPLTPTYQPKLALLAQDGEKFGAWPSTYERCWGDAKYMETLFSALEKQNSWLKTVTPGEGLKRVPPLGRIYLPTADDSQVSEWSLPTEAAIRFHELRQYAIDSNQSDLLRFLRGGSWRSFMVKYDELNHLHKRMWSVSEKVRMMRRGRKRDEALDLLWSAQSSDVYWHSQYGGIYLFKLRAAAYENLIAAENLAEGENTELVVTTTDFDQDGRPEVILSTHHFLAIWSVASGGGIVELDHRNTQTNLLNVMGRHKEPYHLDLARAARNGQVITPESPLFDESGALPPGVVRAKALGLERFLIYDWHRRASYLDHFLREETTLPEFYHAQYAEQGDFVNLPYRVEVKSNVRYGRVTLTRDGHVWIGNKHQPFTVSKTFNFEQEADHYTVTYQLSHPAATPLTVRFGVEFGVGFDGGEDTGQGSLMVNGRDPHQSLTGIREQHGVRQFVVESQLRRLQLHTEFSEPAILWQFPLETISLADTGYESSYQGTVFLALWNLVIPAERPWQFTITQRIIQG